MGEDRINISYLVRNETLTIIKVFASGRTEPEIISGTPVISIQAGVVSVGRIIINQSYDYPVYKEHPVNQDALATIATDLIKKEKPEYLESENVITILCPSSLANTMQW